MDSARNSTSTWNDFHVEIKMYIALILIVRAPLYLPRAIEFK